MTTAYSTDKIREEETGEKAVEAVGFCLVYLLFIVFLYFVFI